MPLFAAREADYAEIIDVVNWAYRGRQGASASWNTEQDVLVGQRLDESLLREDMATRPQAHLLILRDATDGPLLGTAWLDPTSETVWYLGLLAVRPDLQTRRLGSELLGAAEAFAAQRGAHRIRMTVLHMRDTLIAWYQRRGYVLTGETAPFPYGDDRFGRPLRDDLYFVVLEKDMDLSSFHD